jgi:hypothetical protein
MGGLLRTLLVFGLVLKFWWLILLLLVFAAAGHQRRVLRCGSAFKRRVRCEAAVRGDVGENLLHQGEHMGVLDGVDVAPAFLACADQAGQAEFTEVLAHGGHTDAGAFCQGGDVVDVLGGKP